MYRFFPLPLSSTGVKASHVTLGLKRRRATLVAMRSRLPSLKAVQPSAPSLIRCSRICSQHCLSTSRFSRVFRFRPNLYSHRSTRNSPGVTRVGESGQISLFCSIWRRPSHSKRTQDESLDLSQSARSSLENWCRITRIGPPTACMTVVSEKSRTVVLSRSNCFSLRSGNFTVTGNATGVPGSRTYILSGGIVRSQTEPFSARRKWCWMMAGTAHQAFNRQRLQKAATSLR